MTEQLKAKLRKAVLEKHAAAMWEAIALHAGAGGPMIARPALEAIGNTIRAELTMLESL